MRAFIAALGLLAFFGSVETRSLAEEKRAESVKKYRVIIRVVRPELAKMPSVKEARANMGKYAAVSNGVFHPKNPESDEELLKKLNKHNPQFKFSRILTKRTIEAEADKLWDVPEDMTQHSIRLAIVDKSSEIMDMRRQELLKSTNPEEANRGKSLQNLSLLYPANELQEMKADNKTLLYIHHAALNSRYENRAVSVSGSESGARIIENRPTFCLTNALYCMLMGNNGVFKFQWAPTDVVILTILDK
ncbi:MAG: hypothetical protein NT023_12455 [Armatimonadetes bacterium]|nr:hypothetical protein [Armatimonadota bacterium]